MNVYDNAFGWSLRNARRCLCVCVREWVYYYSRFMKKLELEKDAQIEERCRKRWEDKQTSQRMNEWTNVRPNRMKSTKDWGSRCVALFGVVLSVGWKSNHVKKRTWAQQIKPINGKIQGVFFKLYTPLKNIIDRVRRWKASFVWVFWFLVQSWDERIFTSNQKIEVDARSGGGETKESRIDAFHRTMTVNQRNWSQT